MLFDLVPIGDPDRIVLLLTAGGIGLLVLWLVSRVRRKGKDGAPQ